MQLRKFSFWLFLSAILFSCKKEDVPADQEKNIPAGFTFNTIRKVALDIQLLTNTNQPLRGVLVDVYSSGEPEKPVFTAVSDGAGKIVAELNLPTYIDTLVIDPAYVGLMRNCMGVIRNNELKGVIGGTSGFRGDFVAFSHQQPESLFHTTGIQGVAGTTGTVAYKSLYPFDSNGKPTVLAGTDEITARLLSFINASLPERSSVPSLHPEYLSASSLTDLKIEKTADVWVTFVHEGAANTNTLGFYTYPTGTPPATINDIDTIRYVLPNASLAGSGGSMIAGEKVLLGRFQPGVSIGFVLFQNGWRQTSGVVNSSALKFFSTDVLNPETAPEQKRHTVVLYDNVHKLFLVGFEDRRRDLTGGDEDFNDLLFYATSNPVEAISTKDINIVDQPDDADEDGAPDGSDEFPNDPERAYTVYYPSQTTWGTLAFEDLWPRTGDYDLNDLVVGYQYKMINNADNKTVDLEGRYMIRAVGGYLKKGLGVQLECSPQAVSSIQGQRSSAGYISLAGNGTETGQAKAVFFPFDETKPLISPATRVNHDMSNAHINSDTATISVRFNSPLTSAQLGLPPFNPFITVNIQRGYEVHLPGYQPTDKANKALLGTADDVSNATTGKYYVTKDNWPWAINFPEKFQHPTEGNNISKVFSNFLSWATSGGSIYKDWYQNKTGYRNNTLIYTR